MRNPIAVTRVRVEYSAVVDWRTVTLPSGAVAPPTGHVELDVYTTTEILPVLVGIQRT